MSTKNTHLVYLFLLLLSFGATAFLYSYLPDQIVSHWNVQGESDDYMSKFLGVFILPFTMLFIWGVYSIIPVLDPLKKNIEGFRNHYNNFMLSILLFLFYLYALMMIWNLGYTFNFNYFVIPFFAFFLFMIGHLLEKSKRNWFIGIRTPWTLSSDIVWKKTHDIGGKLFKVISIISLFSLIDPSFGIIWLLLIPIICISVFLIVFSYVEYKKQEKKTIEKS